MLEFFLLWLLFWLISIWILGIFFWVFPWIWICALFGWSTIGFICGAGPKFLGLIPINFFSSSSLNIPHIVWFFLTFIFRPLLLIFLLTFLVSILLKSLTFLFRNGWAANSFAVNLSFPSYCNTDLSSSYQWFPHHVYGSNILQSL